MMEQWKQIVVDGVEYDYEVSNMGNIRNNKTGKVLKKSKNKDNYEVVSLYKNGKKKTFKVHRLVAEAFIPNPDNKSCIDHISCVRDDNRVENLRWVTRKENSNNPLTRKNISKAHSGENNPSSTKVICVTTRQKFGSVREAERKTGVNHSDISLCCNGKVKSAGKSETGEKLVWMRYNEYLKQIKTKK